MQHCEHIDQAQSLHRAPSLGPLALAAGALALLVLAGPGWAVVGGVFAAMLLALTERIATPAVEPERRGAKRVLDGGTATARRPEPARTPSVLHTHDGGSFERGL
ncbi:MAG: hypothetical protein PVF91_00010 [Chromatiales bacterium]|jgi:hypothetical protein